MIKDKDGKLIGIGIRSKGNVFNLNVIEMNFLVVRVDKIWLCHRRFFYIKFDNIVKAGSTFAIRDFPRIMEPTYVVC